MPRGGHRNGAGRKKGVANLLTKELRERIDAEGLIQFLQDLAHGKVENASISERKDAAIALLKKVLPDMNRHEGEIEPLQFEPLRFYIPEQDGGVRG
jgi:hypothetical protein